MTKSQAIQKAYHWAWNVANDRKPSLIGAYCANQVLATVDQYGETEACFELLAERLKEWEAAKRESFREPIKILRNCLSVIDHGQPTTAQ